MPTLLFLKEGEPALKRNVGENRLTIGRDSANDIQLLAPEISRTHCTIENQNGKWMLKDSSRNGTHLNDRRISEAGLSPGDKIQIGPWFLKWLEQTEWAEETLIQKKNKLPKETQVGEMLGASRAMQEVFKLIRKAAESDVAACLIGASGTGKELAARSLHDLGARRAKPFVAINCGAIPENLIESILFGHERGAFTGASEKHAGVFEQAHGGTLFLDEIGEMPLDLQTRLLRVLEMRTVRRIGGKSDIAVDVRLITATHRNLQELAARGAFRQDLFYRLYVFPIRLPPLRERPEDLKLLTDHFLKIFSAASSPKILSSEAFRKLKNHSWPGNVRELKNVIQRAILISTSETITASEIEPAPPMGLPEKIGEIKLGEQEKLSLMEALRKSGGNQAFAARLLGIARTTLASKLKRYQIAPSDWR